MVHHHIDRTCCGDAEIKSSLCSSSPPRSQREARSARRGLLTCGLNRHTRARQDIAEIECAQRELSYTSVFAASPCLPGLPRSQESPVGQFFSLSSESCQPDVQTQQFQALPVQPESEKVDESFISEPVQTKRAFVLTNMESKMKDETNIS